MSGRDILDVEKYKRGGHGMLEGGEESKRGSNWVVVE